MQRTPGSLRGQPPDVRHKNRRRTCKSTLRGLERRPEVGFLYVAMGPRTLVEPGSGVGYGELNNLPVLLFLTGVTWLPVRQNLARPKSCVGLVSEATASVKGFLFEICLGWTNCQVPPASPCWLVAFGKTP